MARLERERGESLPLAAAFESLCGGAVKHGDPHAGSTNAWPWGEGPGRGAGGCGLPAPLCPADCAAIGAAPVPPGGRLPRVSVCNTCMDVCMYIYMHLYI